MEIRRATASDLDAVVAIIESQRRQYQKFQPTFWHKAADSAPATKAFFSKLLGEPQTYFLVATEGNQILGLLIARKFPVPPVYAAGETYLPDGMPEPGWYQPVPRGIEAKIGEKLAWLRSLDDEARSGGTSE